MLRPENVEFFRLEKDHRWYGASISPSGIVLFRCLDCDVERERSTALAFYRDAAQKSGIPND